MAELRQAAEALLKEAGPSYERLCHAVVPTSLLRSLHQALTADRGAGMGVPNDAKPIFAAIRKYEANNDMPIPNGEQLAVAIYVALCDITPPPAIDREELINTMTVVWAGLNRNTISANEPSPNKLIYAYADAIIAHIGGGK